MTVNRTAGRSFVFLLALLVLSTVARADVTGVLARGQGDRFWLLRTEVDADKKTTTSIRRLADPVAGDWVESLRLPGQFSDAAPLADRLALLSADGSWQLVWDGGQVNGPVPPEGYTLRRIASDANTLWAIATKTGQAGDLLKWTEAAGWSVIARLPDDADMPDVSLGVVAGTPWLVCGDPKSPRVFRRSTSPDMPWQPVGQPLAHQPLYPNAWVSNATRPLLRVRLGDGGVGLLPVDGVTREPAVLSGGASASVTAVGPNVRVVAIQEKKVVQFVVDDYGRGKSFGPDVIPDPAPPKPERMEWINLILLLGLTVAMLRSLRADPIDQTPIAAGLRTAPLWRRAFAAIIDASPAIAVAVYVISTFEGSAEELKLTPTNFYLPVYLSLFAYLGHVTVSEIWFGTSLGKWLFRLRVVALDGARPPAGAIVLRNLLRVVEFALVLPLFMPLMTPTGQRIGDMAAKTLVVTRDRPTETESSQSDD